jgi:hypothetical protein
MRETEIIPDSGIKDANTILVGGKTRKQTVLRFLYPLPGHQKAKRQRRGVPVKWRKY